MRLGSGRMAVGAVVERAVEARATEEMEQRSHRVVVAVTVVAGGHGVRDGDTRRPREQQREAGCDQRTPCEAAVRRYLLACEPANPALEEIAVREAYSSSHR